MLLQIQILYDVFHPLFCSACVSKVSVLLLYVFIIALNVNLKKNKKYKCFQNISIAVYLNSKDVCLNVTVFMSWCLFLCLER